MQLNMEGIYNCEMYCNKQQNGILCHGSDTTFKLSKFTNLGLVGGGKKSGESCNIEIASCQL